MYWVGRCSSTSRGRRAKGLASVELRRGGSSVGEPEDSRTLEWRKIGSSNEARRRDGTAVIAVSLAPYIARWIVPKVRRPRLAIDSCGMRLQAPTGVCRGVPGCAGMRRQGCDVHTAATPVGLFPFFFLLLGLKEHIIFLIQAQDEVSSNAPRGSSLLNFWT